MPAPLDVTTEHAIWVVAQAYAHVEACDCPGTRCPHVLKYGRASQSLRRRIRQLVAAETARCAAIARAYREEQPYEVQRRAGRTIARRIEGKE
jgi:hypothetical protein